MSKRRVEVKPEWLDAELEAAMGQVMAKEWSQQAIEILEYCWPRGVRANIIAAKIGQVTGTAKTAGAVRAKADRMELKRECL